MLLEISVPDDVPTTNSSSGTTVYVHIKKDDLAAGIEHLNRWVRPEWIRVNLAPSESSTPSTYLSVNTYITEAFGHGPGNPPTPDSVTPSSTFLAWWVCGKCGAEFEMRVVDRVALGADDGCPECNPFLN